MANNAHRTAIARRKISTPMARLNDKGLLKGRCLDYGCGRGFDCDSLGLEGFDPYYRPTMPEGTFDTVTCCYVLNVLESEADRRAVLVSIASCLNTDGVAYIAVRNDKNALMGWTSKGTWQGLVVLGLPIVFRTPDCVIYRFTRDNASCDMVATISEK